MQYAMDEVMVMASALRLGLAVKIAEGPERIIRKAHKLGFDMCQVGIRDPVYYSSDTLAILQDESKTYGVDITAVWAGAPGRVVWDFVEGPKTVGLVPLGTRRARADLIMQASDFAAKLGIKCIITHIGFIPEDPNASFTTLIPILREIAEYCERNDQWFCWETGQETPITLLRTIEDTGCSNVGVNFDPANLLLYGKANPVDALDILGPFVKGVHVKDGEYPTDWRSLGVEKTVGEGRVDFPELLRQLMRHGYQGSLCIESEFAGGKQIESIKQAKKMLEYWLAEF